MDENLLKKNYIKNPQQKKILITDCWWMIQTKTKEFKKKLIKSPDIKSPQQQKNINNQLLMEFTSKFL